jgi:hypothetical protein
VSARAPTRKDHRQFCAVEGWAEVTDARGRSVGHHVTLELRLPDTTVLRTRISRPLNTDTYGPSLFSHILRDQLCVTLDEFWACVDGTPPGRAQPPPPVPSLPASLVHQLLQLGIPESEVAAMSRDEAITRMQAHWSRPTD